MAETKVKLSIPKAVKAPKVPAKKARVKKGTKATKEPKVKFFKTKLKVKSKMRKI